MTQDTWPDVAQALIDFVRQFQPWWFDGTEARCYGDTVLMTNPYDLRGEECVVCNGKFQDGLALQFRSNVDSAHKDIGTDKVVYFAHIECVKSLHD